MNLKRPLATGIDRRRFVQTGLVAALAAPAIVRGAHAQQRFLCRIAHSEALGSPMTEYFEKWTGVLNSESGGRIEAQHFPASQLGGFAELIESSRIGTIQVTTGGPDADEAVAFAREHGLPVVVKAAFGGGGRGLKVARTIEEVPDAFDSATREAVAAFGRGECFIERFLERPRHVEAQVLGDGRGGVVVVGDRDCSLQRRSQKLVEEAPAPGLTDEQRARIHESSRAICAAVDYRGAGTVEFLLGADGTISFLEVNTRLQVEHPVTEAVTGIDLVREQLRIAEGHGPSITETPAPSGHAIELRLNAEDPGRGFLPSPGRITALRVPAGPGVRWDAGVEAGDAVEAAFDSLAAKLIVHAADRDAALVRMRRALGELEVTGIATVAPFARAVLDERLNVMLRVVLRSLAVGQV